jgi:hypothetical protein
MKIDFNSLTLDEVELVESLTQKSIESVMDEGVPRGRALKALIFVISKRTNPDYTFEQAGKLSLAEAANLFSGLSEEKKD